MMFPNFQARCGKTIRFVNLGTDNVRGQRSEYLLAPNEGYCLYVALKGVRKTKFCAVIGYPSGQDVASLSARVCPLYPQGRKWCLEFSID